MTTKTEKFTSENSFLPPFHESNIPQQLIEVNELLKSISNRLEDCALEWQAEISRKQWKLINSKAVRGNSFEQSLLSRTYFSEKCLDQAFQHLLVYKQIFSEYLKAFIDLLQEKLPNSTSDKASYDVQNHCCNTNQKMLNNDNTEPVHVSTFKNKYLNKTKKFQNCMDNILTAQKLYISVVSAKENFDTKLLEFEAVLHKIASIPTDAICLYQHWPNILRTTPTKSKKFGNTAVNQNNRLVTKTKYLTRSSKLFKKRAVEKSSLLINNIGDQLLYRTHTKFC